MEVVSTIISALLFAAFVPGVIGSFPKGSSKGTVLVVHALLFAFTTHYVMSWYWGMKENMGNYGTSCPKGYVMTMDEKCVPSSR
jgi:hypothetical protein